MRTTIRIEDELYRRVKTRAASSGRTVGEVVEDALRVSLDTSEAQRDATDLRPLPVFGGSGVMPGVDLADTGSLRELMDAGRSLDEMR